MKNHQRVSVSVLTAWVIGLGAMAAAEDWPRWMGPTGDNNWNAQGILREFPDGGPKIVWRSPAANGYSGPAVARGRVYVTDFVTSADVKISNFDRREISGTERVLCLDADSGNEIWQREDAVTYAISYPSGPRCTPVVDSERVYTLGAEGILNCLHTKDGSVVWSRQLKSDFKTNSPLWGYASTPLIDGEKLICLVGGEGSHTVAFDKMTGQELWRYGTASEQGYSPPVIINAGGTRQLIITSPDYVVSLSPDSGKEFWKLAYGASNGSIIMTPVHSGNYLFVGGYSNRNLMMELSSDRPEASQLFRDKPKLGISPVNVQPYLEKDVMYGMDQSGELMAVEIPSGNRLWSTGQPVADRPVGNGTAFIVQNDAYFYLFAETGELVIAKLSRDGYQELDRAKILEPTNNAFGRPVAWCAPAFANGRMYVRTDQECLCVELTADRN
ncbi:MAG: PQQ-binding-like beta-propeller repeat protein [Pirellulaceae bacterium]